jgi:hypothetical protein
MTTQLNITGKPRLKTTTVAWVSPKTTDNFTGVGYPIATVNPKKTWLLKAHTTSGQETNNRMK